jgi:hypothetical protein
MSAPACELPSTEHSTGIDFDPLDSLMVVTDSIENLEKKHLFVLFDWTPREDIGKMTAWLIEQRPDLEWEIRKFAGRIVK